MSYKFILIIVLFCSFHGYSLNDKIYNQNSQLSNITVEGVVRDSGGTPLPGAAVIEKGTANGTQTDFDGKFSLTVADTESIIVFSYLGYITQEIKVSETKFFEIFLQEDLAKLDEVVIIGYGTVKKKDATGSVVSVKAEDLNKGNIVTAENLLQGRVAGLSINTGGGPGSGSVIRIRGGSSLNASNDPLLVIDGLPVDNNNVGGSRSILSTINPNEIESFTVL